MAKRPKKMAVPNEAGYARQRLLARCEGCSNRVPIRGRYIFRDGTQHVGAYCKGCVRFFYVPHMDIPDMEEIPLIASQREQKQSPYSPPF